MNYFKNLYSESLTQQAKINTYGSTTPVSEQEVYAAYSEFLSVAFAIGSEVSIYCEQADVIAEKHGVAKAFLYAEAEEGFFKKILNALIKVYNKAKDFVVKLLGRVKSDKTYRQDLTYLQSLVQSAQKVTFNDNASMTVKKARYGAIGGIVVGIMKSDSVLLTIPGVGDGDNKDATTLDKVNQALKTVLEEFASENKADIITGIADRLGKLQSENPTKDVWLKNVYNNAINAFDATNVDKTLGDAKFDKSSAGTALEQVNKLWDTATKTLKGHTDIMKFINSFFKPLFDDAKGIQYDTIAKALEKGVSELEDKIDDLKSLLKEVEGESSRAMTNGSGDNANLDKNAKAASSMSVKYSNVMSMYTVVITEGFNTAKVQLDRLIAEFKGYGSQIDKLRKNNSSTASE